ncbi:MAG: hypothetical protein U9N59_05225 [Campylobacterota bacterium]|nr:hypothetical protein [Campylobacterota bacterium]
MNIQKRATNGLKSLFKEVSYFSQVQGAWRFLNNSKVEIHIK